MQDSISIPKGRPRFGKRRILFTALLSLFFLTPVLLRLQSTAEGIVLLGDPREKADLCRVIPTLSLPRQERILRRLLKDPSAEVRLGAITASVRPGGAGILTEEILALLLADGESPEVRSKAASHLLALTPPHPRAASYLITHQREPDFRRDFAEPLARLQEIALPTMTEEERKGLLLESLDLLDPAHEAFIAVLRNHLDRFTGFRTILLAHLRGESSEASRQFALATLTRADGVLRGQNAEDWEETSLSPAEENALYPFEAEWAVEIRPNYMIQEKEGVRCLALDEGAGGIHSWLKGRNGSVDIGEARFSLFAPAEGLYIPWARVYFNDKCGNSFGFTLNGHAGGGDSFNDYKASLKDWHWIPLNRLGDNPKSHTLTRGFHRAVLTAWEDDVFIDRFALVPEGKHPDELSVTPAVRWDPLLLPCISFTPAWQTQPRGTTQSIVIWVRRHHPGMKRGELTVTVPDGFQALGGTTSTLTFAEGNPLARTSIRLHLPGNSRTGEGLLKAVYTDETGEGIQGEMILGAHYDWLTTGPLPPEAPFLSVMAKGRESGAQRFLEAYWLPFPTTGYDAFRRLDPEAAWGDLENRQIYFTTLFEAELGGEFLGLLNADDSARVYLDDQEVISQPNNGPGEGRLVQKPIPITPGKHRLLIHLTQADFKDPGGTDPGRQSANQCNLKLLLRESRLRPATSLKGLPRSHRQGETHE